MCLRKQKEREGGMTDIPHDYLAKAELILKNCLAHAGLEHPLISAVLPRAVASLAEDVAADPEAFRLSKIGPAPVAPPESPAPPPPPREVVERLDLPAMPAILGRLNKAMADPRTTAGDLAAIIRLDPALAASLLRLVNSPAYSPAMPVESIARAVVVLGTRQVYTLALGGIVARASKGFAARDARYEEYWEHSVACAVLARELAALAGVKDPETAFVAGLLHDIGRLGLRTGLRDQSLVIEHKAGTGRRPQLDVEREVLGYDHAYLGGGLLRVWGIPESIVQGVGFHHAPLEAGRVRLACVVHVADILANMFSVHPTALVYAPALLPEAWEALGLDPAEVAARLAGLDDAVAELVGVLIGDSAGRTPRRS
jgi:putative nucleotidyltransferase with HDIG domain